jgi:predicted methyltransferase
MRQHTPEELAEAKRILAAVEPLRKEMEAKALEEQRKNTSTIAMLERRTRTQTIDLPLEGGDYITVFSRLSQAEGAVIEGIEQDRLDSLREAGTLMQMIKADGKTPEEITLMQAQISRLISQSSDCYLKIIAKVTADPELTYEWLKENPDKYNAEDIVDTYYAFREARRQQVADREERVRAIIAFRADAAREGLHPVPKVDGDSGSG